MVFFGRKKTKIQSEKGITPQAHANVGTATHDHYAVLLRPRITEKASHLMERGAYTFEVARDTSKRDVRSAMKEIFKVTPRKVTIVNRAPRTTHSRARGRRVTVHGIRKAHVFLKKGESINLV